MRRFTTLVLSLMLSHLSLASRPIRSGEPATALEEDPVTEIGFNLTFPPEVPKPKPWPVCCPHPYVEITLLVVEVPATRRVGNTLLIGVMRGQFWRMETHWEIPDQVTWSISCEREDSSTPPSTTRTNSARQDSPFETISGRFFSPRFPAEDSTALLSPSVLTTKEAGTLPVLRIDW